MSSTHSFILTFSVPEVAFESMLIKVREFDATVSVCVELKSNLKRDADVYLEVFGDSASGEILPNALF